MPRAQVNEYDAINVLCMYVFHVVGRPAEIVVRSGSGDE